MVQDRPPAVSAAPSGNPAKLPETGAVPALSSSRTSPDGGDVIRRSRAPSSCTAPVTVRWSAPLPDTSTASAAPEGRTNPPMLPVPDTLDPAAAVTGPVAPETTSSRTSLMTGEPEASPPRVTVPAPTRVSGKPPVIAPVSVSDESVADVEVPRVVGAVSVTGPVRTGETLCPLVRTRSAPGAQDDGTDGAEVPEPPILIGMANVPSPKPTAPPSSTVTASGAASGPLTSTRPADAPSATRVAMSLVPPWSRTWPGPTARMVWPPVIAPRSETMSES